MRRANGRLALSSHSMLKEAIRLKAAELGFVASGFARADAVPGAGAELGQWIAAGHHGDWAGWRPRR